VQEGGEWEGKGVRDRQEGREKRKEKKG